MAGQDPELHPEAQVRGREEGRRGRQRLQSLEPVIGQAAHVLQPEALLDEAKDVLDPPAGDVRLDDMPDRLPAAADREVRQSFRIEIEFSQVLLYRYLDMPLPSRVDTTWTKPLKTAQF